MSVVVGLWSLKYDSYSSYIRGYMALDRTNGSVVRTDTPWNTDKYDFVYAMTRGSWIIINKDKRVTGSVDRSVSSWARTMYRLARIDFSYFNALEKAPHFKIHDWRPQGRRPSGSFLYGGVIITVNKHRYWHHLDDGMWCNYPVPASVNTVEDAIKYFRPSSARDFPTYKFGSIYLVNGHFPLRNLTRRKRKTFRIPHYGTNGKYHFRIRGIKYDGKIWTNQKVVHCGKNGKASRLMLGYHPRGWCFVEGKGL